jgi:hypothetical protein
VFIKGCTAVIADFLDVIPYIASVEAHTALVGCVLMWALCLNQEFSEIIQGDPRGLIAAAFTHGTRDMTNIFMSLAVLCFSHRQISFAIAVLALCKNLYFDHQ